MANPREWALFWECIGMFLAKCCLIVQLLACTFAFAGNIVTREGKTIRGQLTPAGESSIKISPADGAAIVVDLGNVRLATFGDTSPAPLPILKDTWKNADLGKVHLRGSAVEKEGSFSISASGWGAWGPKDSGHIAYWPLEGDGQIIAHVAPPADENAGTIAGVMFRATLDAASAFGATLVYPTHETRFTRRPAEGYVPGPERRPNAVPFEWVRLARDGKTLTASRSREGRFWVPIHSQVIEMPASLLAGLFVSSGNNAEVVSATFDHVRIIPGTPSATYFEGAIGPTAGLVLVDGTMLAGHPRSIDQGNVWLYPQYGRDGGKLDWPVTEARQQALKTAYLTFPQAAVARLRFAPEPPSLDQVNPGHSAGVLLLGGDFLEGEVARFSYWQYMEINSVVFGNRHIDALREPICAVLNDVKLENTQWEVRLADGSMIEAKSIRFMDGMVEVNSALAGMLRYPLGELLSVEMGTRK